MGLAALSHIPLYVLKNVPPKDVRIKSLELVAIMLRKGCSKMQVRQGTPVEVFALGYPSEPSMW